MTVMLPFPSPFRLRFYIRTEYPSRERGGALERGDLSVFCGRSCLVAPFSLPEPFVFRDPIPFCVCARARGAVYIPPLYVIGLEDFVARTS